MATVGEMVEDGGTVAVGTGTQLPATSKTIVANRQRLRNVSMVVFSSCSMCNLVDAFTWPVTISAPALTGDTEPLPHRRQGLAAGLPGPCLEPRTPLPPMRAIAA